MNILYIVAACVVAYLAGSVPSAVWVGKIFYGIDIRQHGSKNAGATNTFRVLGVKAGIPVLLMDVFKGFLAANLVIAFKNYIPDVREYVNLQLLFGAIAVIGHIFPIYVGFKGGKGVATLLGIILAIAPVPGLIALGVFVITLLISRYVSLSSLIAGISFPILVIIVFKTTVTSLMLFSVIISILLLLTHQKNIERLLKKEENKANIFKRHRNNR